MPTPRMPTRCPCGSGRSYAECCGPLHRGGGPGGAVATTAEWLMRSRYSAFAVGDPSYLLATWHPSTRPPSLQLAPELTWRRLEIVGVTAGGEGDHRGTVEFVAHFWDAADRRAGEQRETSAFRRTSGRWFYVRPIA